MRRVILAFTLVLVSMLASGVAAPFAFGVHAQSCSPTMPSCTPAGPTVTVTPNPVTTGSTATVQGTGFTPNNYVFVYWQRPDGTTNGTTVFTDAAGNFSLTLGFLPSHGAGTEYIAGYDYGTSRWSPFYAETVTTGTPPASTEYLTAAPNPVVVGNTTTVTGYAFSPNNYVYVQWMRPDGTSNATYVYTDPNGTFAFGLGFLPSHGCGQETLQAFDYGTQTWSAPYVITVTGC